MKITVGTEVRKKNRKPFQNKNKIAIVSEMTTMEIPNQHTQTGTKIVDAVLLKECEGPVRLSILEPIMNLKRHPRHRNIIIDKNSNSPLRQKQPDVTYEHGISCAQVLLDELKAYRERNLTQVGMSWNQHILSEGKGARVTVARASDIEEFKTYINLHILQEKGTKKKSMESCMSVPDKKIQVKRYSEIVIEHLTEDGTIQETITGFLAVVLKHEHDHLDGKLITDYQQHPKRKKGKKKK